MLKRRSLKKRVAAEKVQVEAKNQAMAVEAKKQKEAKRLEKLKKKRYKGKNNKGMMIVTTMRRKK